jgi:hypothetical protein
LVPAAFRKKGVIGVGFFFFSLLAYDVFDVTELPILNSPVRVLYLYVFRVTSNNTRKKRKGGGVSLIPN